MEKLKIYVTARIAEIIEKDAEGFEFFKRDGRTLNKNALLTKLIVNYHKKFTQEQGELFGFLKKRISTSTAIDERALDGLCFDICEKLNERNASPSGEKFNVLISLKPTRESEPVIDYIEQYSLMGRTLSEYFRSMFASYVLLPQDKREEIIFKPQYDAVLKAMKEKKKVFITTSKGKNSKIEISPYAIVGSKEELHLYVIGVQKTCTPLRLSRIVGVTQLAADAVFTEQQRLLAEKMIKYGPQFIYRTDEEEVLVELTERGLDKYKKIYVHRPIPVKIEGNLYYFQCSYSQIVQYFVRFGGDAKIIYPQSVRNEICSFHRRALSAYNKQDKN